MLLMLGQSEFSCDLELGESGEASQTWASPPKEAGSQTFFSPDATGRACRRQRAQLAKDLPVLLVRNLPGLDPLPTSPIDGSEEAGAGRRRRSIVQHGVFCALAASSRRGSGSSLTFQQRHRGVWLCGRGINHAAI